MLFRQFQHILGPISLITLKHMLYHSIANNLFSFKYINFISVMKNKTLAKNAKKNKYLDKYFSRVFKATVYDARLNATLHIDNRLRDHKR